MMTSENERVLCLDNVHISPSRSRWAIAAFHLQTSEAWVKGQSVSRDGNVTDESHLEGFSAALCYCQWGCKVSKPLNTLESHSYSTLALLLALITEICLKQISLFTLTQGFSFSRELLNTNWAKYHLYPSQRGTLISCGRWSTPQPENHLKHPVKTTSTILAPKATEPMTVLLVENRRSEWLILVPFFTDTLYRKKKYFPSNLDIEHAPPAMKLQRFPSFWLSIITLSLQGGICGVTILNAQFLHYDCYHTSMKAV